MHEDLENIKANHVNTVIFNLPVHQIKCWAFFGTPGSAQSFSPLLKGGGPFVVQVNTLWGMKL